MNANITGERTALAFSPIEGNLETESEIGIILPTYCEVANIEKLIQEIESLKLDISILVVDDSSPDQTADAVRRLQKRYENLLLLVRPGKSGLGTAITDGFKAFLTLKKPPNCVMTMDADYSHSPRDLPRLIEPVQKGSDLVIGSRYCQGGGTREWSILRLILSKVANLITRVRIDAQVSDYTSGMRCYSTRLIKGIINDLHSQTYEIQIETIRQAHKRKFRIRETPIIFVNRKKGKSKLSVNEIKDFLSYIFSLNRRY